MLAHRAATSSFRSRGPTSLLRRLSSSAAYASAPYRQLAWASDQQKTAWAAEDTKLHAKMREHVPEALAHNGEEAFDHHLVGVQSVLRSWQAPKHLCDAALFHSVYGTEGFQGFKLPLSHRAELVELIGADAEKLAWIFCMVDRASVDETVFDAVQYVDGRANASLPMFAPRFRARVELGAFQISLTSTAEWLDFITLSLADWLEQVEGAARAENPPVLWGKGEAWAYRRDGYAAMAALLAEHGPTAAIREAAPRMHAEVYGREPEATRDLVQPVTPPVSAAAREAYEAIASAQLDGSAVGTPRVPTDFAPARRRATDYAPYVGE